MDSLNPYQSSSLAPESAPGPTHIRFRLLRVFLSAICMIAAVCGVALAAYGCVMMLYFLATEWLRGKLWSESHTIFVIGIAIFSGMFGSSGVLIGMASLAYWRERYKRGTIYVGLSMATLMIIPLFAKWLDHNFR